MGGCISSCAGTDRSDRLPAGFQIFSLAQLRKDQGRGRILQFPCGRSAYLHGTRGEYAHSGQSRLGYRHALTSASASRAAGVLRSVVRPPRCAGSPRCKEALARYTSEDNAVNPGQVLWGINQGAVYHDLRVRHMQQIAELDLPGYAIGGLAVGETARGNVRYHFCGRGIYAAGQAALSHGRRNAGKYHRGSIPRRGLL